MRWRMVLLLTLLSIIPLGTNAQPGGGGPVVREDQTAYLARCQRETIALYPRAAPQANSICRSRWDMITATGPLADAVLSLAPAPGAAFDPAGARGRLQSVRWGAKPRQGFVASGRLGEIDVGVARTPAPSATFSWFKNGEPIPFDLQEALIVRGAKLAMIGCQNFGAAEGGRVYHVTAPDKAPFGLSISFRSAAVASQSSDYSATADYSGRLPTLAALRRDGSEWSAGCPK
jgi:hypothetical protein